MGLGLGLGFRVWVGLGLGFGTICCLEQSSLVGGLALSLNGFWGQAALVCFRISVNS